MDKDPDSDCSGLTCNQPVCVSRSKKTLPSHAFTSEKTISLNKISYPKQLMIKNNVQNIRATQQLQEKNKTQESQTSFTHCS